MCSLPTKAAGLLGIDFMGKTGARIDFDKGNLSLAVVSKVLKILVVYHSGKKTLPSLQRIKMDTGPIPTNWWHERQKR
jgi:hypothetical protein